MYKLVFYYGVVLWCAIQALVLWQGRYGLALFHALLLMGSALFVYALTRAGVISRDVGDKTSDNE